MSTIYKYQLEVTDRQRIRIPVAAELLCVQTQNGAPCLWALVQPDAPLVDRHFETFGTGHPISEDMGVSRRYVGTYQLDGGSLVFHVFEWTGV